MKPIITFFLVLIGLNLKAQTNRNLRIIPDSVTMIVHKFSIPGIALIVSTSDSTLFSHTVGLRNINKGDSLKLSDRMHLGSCSKAFTGYLAAIIVTQGLIKWETTLIEVFPELKNKIKEAYYHVTLKDLLSHHGGIQPFDNMDVWLKMDNKKQFTGKSIRESRYKFSLWVLQKEPARLDTIKGKEDFIYSNAGYVVATAMLEKVTNNSWEQLMQDLVFTPLHIDAIFGWPASKNFDQPWGHWLNQDKSDLTPVSPNGSWYIPDIADPAGDISMSIVDYGKWLQKNLKGLKGDDEEFNDLFYKNLHYANIDYSYYSMGWASFKDSVFTISTHSGSARTFYCHVTIVKELDLAVAAICNAGSEEAKEGTILLVNRIVEQYKKKQLH